MKCLWWREKLKELNEMGKILFNRKHDYTHHNGTIKENFEELEEKTVSVAGRIISRRVMVKLVYGSSR